MSRYQIKGAIAGDAAIIKRLLGYCWPQRRQITLSLVLLIAVAGLQLAGPYLVKVAIDDYILKGDYGGLDLLIAFYIVVLTAAFLLQYAQIHIMQLCGQRTMYDLRVELFAHLQQMSPAFFSRNLSGKIITNVVNDVEILHELFAQGVVVVLADGLTLIGVIIAMFLLDFRLAAIITAVILPLYFVIRIYREKARAIYRDIRLSLDRLNASLQENIAGMLTVQLFNRQEANFQAFERVSRANRDAQIASIECSAVFFPLIEVFAAIALATIIWYGGGEVTRGAVQLGVLVAFIQYVQRLFQPLKDLADSLGMFQDALAAAERIFRLLDTPADIRWPKKPLLPEAARGEIEFKDVWFAYETDDPVLKGISFKLNAGESVAIVGATGAGKTSLINLIGRFYDPQAGEIFVDGVAIRKLDRRFLRRQIGMVLQDAFLFAGDIEYNIGLDDPRITAGQVYEAARAANAHTFIERLPQGYRQPVKERGGVLSLGQKQLIALARALAFDPPVLILDEATSSVDGETQALINEALGRLIDGRTAIIIAHRLATVSFAKKIIVIDDGRIAEIGSHEELLARGGMYWKLHILQGGQ